MNRQPLAIEFSNTGLRFCWNWSPEDSLALRRGRAIPALTRALMSALSNCVSDAITVKIISPCGVVVSINAEPNRKYFNTDRGATYDNFIPDQFTGFHAIVIPGTLRDSMYILDGLLEHQTRLRPAEIMADAAGVSDVVFGLFGLVGYQCNPRLADLGAAQFWRLDPRVDSGGLRGLARTRAIGALGRILKTLYMLTYGDDERYRRNILTQLSHGESRHSAARAVFHRQRGELRPLRDLSYRSEDDEWEMGVA